MAFLTGLMSSLFFCFIINTEAHLGNPLTGNLGLPQGGIGRFVPLLGSSLDTLRFHEKYNGILIGMSNDLAPFKDNGALQDFSYRSMKDSYILPSIKEFRGENKNDFKIFKIREDVFSPIKTQPMILPQNVIFAGSYPFPQNNQVAFLTPIMRKAIVRIANEIRQSRPSSIPDKVKSFREIGSKTEIPIIGKPNPRPSEITSIETHFWRNWIQDGETWLDRNIGKIALKSEQMKEFSDYIDLIKNIYK